MAAGSTYTPISTQTLGSSSSTVTFSSIPSTYTDLYLMYSPLASSNTTIHTMRVNGDTGTNYSMTFMRGDGTSATSNRKTSQTSLTMYPDDYDNTAIPNVIGVNFMNYSNTTTYKTMVWRAGFPASGQGTSASVGLWRSTAAISSIVLTSSNNFTTGSTFTLYGIAAA